MSKKCTNCNKPTVTCGTVMYAPCVTWEVPTDLQEYVLQESGSEPTECANLDELLEELYTKVKDIEEQLDFTEFESDCLEVAEDEESGEITLHTVITAFDEKICELVETVEGLDDICTFLDKDITDCDGLDFSCFTTDECDNPIVITSLKSLIQVLIDKVCALESA